MCFSPESPGSGLCGLGSGSDVLAAYRDHSQGGRPQRYLTVSATDAPTLLEGELKKDKYLSSIAPGYARAPCSVITA